MIRATDIHSLTDFTRNAREYIQHIKTSKTPIAITVNGDAQVVVQDAESYQRMVDELEQARAEIASHNLAQSPAIPPAADHRQPFSMIRSGPSER